MKFHYMEREPLKNPSNFRRMALGVWHDIGDPQVYALLEVDVEQALEYIAKVRAERGIHLTINHIVAKILSLGFRRFPQINGVIANGKIYLRKHVDAFLHVGIEGAETELVGVCVRDADKKSIFEVAEDIRRKSERVRQSAQHPMRKSQGIFRFIPWRLIPFAVKFMNWLEFDLNLSLARFGIPRDPFGSFMQTSIGSFDMEAVWVPTTFLGRNNFQMAVGKIYKKPVVMDDDSIVVRHRMNLCVTFDHRFMDGVFGSKLAKFVMKRINNLNDYIDEIEHSDLTEEERQKRQFQNEDHLGKDESKANDANAIATTTTSHNDAHLGKAESESIDSKTTDATSHNEQ